MAKLYPVVLVPLALIELWRRGRGRAVSQGVGAALAVLAAGIGPFLVLAPHGLWWAAHRQLVRPVQVESLAAAVFAAAHMLAGAHLHVVKSSGSDNLVGTGPDLAGTISSVASLLALVVVYVYYVRGPATRERLVTASVAAVAVFIAFTKVFSPQYLIWLMPIVPLLGGRAGARAAGLFAVAVGLTQIWEPYRYYDYYSTFAPWLVTLVVVRDLLVVAIVVVLVRALARSERRRGAARCRSRARRRLSSRRRRLRSARPSRRARTGPASSRASAGSRARRGRRSPSRAAPSCRRRVTAAVPPGWMRASFVWTWVCVPITAVTRPSSQRAIATFSLVASAWKSTTTTGVSARASSTSASTISHGLTGVSRKSEPSRLSTATRVPSAASTIASPRPGVSAPWFAGRITRSLAAR